MRISDWSSDVCSSDLHADIAMYHAKKQGKDRYSWFEPSMVNELRLRHDLEASIRYGIAAGEFVPYYEQQIDLDTGELVGFEMLARWESPKLGLTRSEEHTSELQSLMRISYAVFCLK